MTEKRYSHNAIVIVDHLKKDLIYIDGNENLLDLAEYVDRLQYENEQLKARIQLLSTLLDIADAIIDLSDDEKAKAFWEKKNRETEQEWEKILSDDEK